MAKKMDKNAGNKNSQNGYMNGMETENNVNHKNGASNNMKNNTQNCKNANDCK